MTKKITSLLLALLMVLPLAACAEDKTSADTTAADTTAAVADTAETTEPVETEDPNTVDNLPADLNFGDETFTIYTRNFDSIHPNLDVQESNGEQLNDALYQRGRDVEARLGIVLDEMMSISTDTAPIKTAIQAGDTTYKLATVRCVYTVEYASSDLGYDWSQVDHIDLSKDYWYDSINKNLTIAGKTFTAAGAYNLSSFDFTHILMFNKKLISDLNLESPFDIVKNKQWTWDKLIEMGTAATSDMNGDGKMELGPDRFGLFCISKQLTPSFWISAGQETITKDENDMPVFTMNNDTMMNVLNKIYELAWDNNFWYPYTTNMQTDAGMNAAFAEDLGLFINSTFFYVKDYREMEADFGIIPFPMFNAEQDNYYSRIEGCDLPLIPSCLSQEQANMSGAFLEAMSSYSLKNTIPVYYEVYLKTKLARDSESAEMLDIIFANRIFDLGDTVWCPNVRDGFIYSMFNANNRNLASMMKKSTTAIQKAIDKISDGFTD